MAAYNQLNISSSEFENDPFEESETYHRDTSMDYISQIIIYFITVSIIKFVLSLVVLSADIFLICVICKYERLKSRFNMYILNCSILNILHIMSKPMFFILQGIIRLDYGYECYQYNAMNFFLVLYVVFAIALALDWFLSGYTPNMMEKYNKFYKYVFIGLYVVFLAEGSIALTVCNLGNTGHLVSRHYIFMVLYVISLIALVVLNILSKQVNLRNGSSKTAYSLTVTNIIIFSYLPLLIFHIVQESVGYSVWDIMLFTDFIPIFIALLHPILVVYMLGKQNKYFKMAYQRSFKRSVRNYGDENLDDSSDVENDVSNDGGTVNSTESKQELKLAIDI